MERRGFEQLEYVLRMPTQFLDKEKYPLVIYLHGAGGRGRDMDVIYNHPFFSETELCLQQAISVAPQCYADSWFDIFEQLQEFVDYVKEESIKEYNKKYIGSISVSEETLKKSKSCALTIYFCDDGEDVWNIAREYNTTVDAIMSENDLSERIIHKGRMMLIPSI